MRDELVSAIAAYGSKDGNAIDEGCQERAEDELIAGIADEVADQARPVLHGGHRQNGDRN